MFFFCSYHVNNLMSNILYGRTMRDKPFPSIALGYDLSGPLGLYETVLKFVELLLRSGCRDKGRRLGPIDRTTNTLGFCRL